MSVKFTWRGGEAGKEMHRRYMRGLMAMLLHAQKEARELASVHNEGVRMRRTRDTARGKKGSQYTIYPNSSKPGESPRRRTGFGQKSIVIGWNDNSRVGRVGFLRNAKYMAMHELGIRGVVRPTLATMLARNKNTFQTIFEKAARGGNK